jgi:FkbM family methyltransferase
MNKDPLEYRLDLVEARFGKPACVVVGAMDGIQFDSLGPRIQKGDWPALMIEPMPSAFKQLEHNFKDCKNVNLANVAVGGETGSMDIYYVDPKLYDKDPNNAWMAGISTLNPNQGDITSIPKEFIRKKKVPITNLASVLESHQVTRCNILQIDTEGYDAKVLMQFPLAHILPELIIMECIHITVLEYRNTTKLLNSLGYSLVEHNFDLVATRGI